MQSWSFGILCYNEAGTLERVYRDVVTLVSEWQLDDYEILIIDDGSQDGTPAIIHRLATQDPHILPIIHPRNMGIGAGIRDIYFKSTRENVVFIPGDGQFNVQELKPYAGFDDHIFLCFYRKENLTYSTFRNILSAFNKWFNRIFLGLDLRDVNWVKVYKRHLLHGLKLKISSSAIESEICAKLLITGCLPHEIPSRYLPRTAGQSQGASLQSIIRVVRELFYLFLSVQTFRFTYTSSSAT